jgi:hypothetical protein
MAGLRQEHAFETLGDDGQIATKLKGLNRGVTAPPDLAETCALESAIRLAAQLAEPSKSRAAQNATDR